MEERGETRRGLGRRLSTRLGWGSQDSGRRWLIKILNGDIERPEPEQIQALEAELGLKRGYFKVPAQPQRDARLTAIQRHLEALEDAVGEVLTNQREGLRLLRALRDSGARIRPAAREEKEQ